VGNAAADLLHRGFGALPFIFLGNNYQDEPLRVHFLGESFSHPPFRLGQAFQTNARISDLETLAEEVYDAWSKFSVRLAASSSEDELTTILRAALRASYEYTKLIFNFNSANLFVPFCEWALGGSEPVIVQNPGVSVPWHLLYCSPTAPGAANIEDEARFLLGLQRPVVFQIVLAEASRPESGDVATDLLFSVGGNLPGFNSLNDAVLQVEGKLKQVFPEATRKRLHTFSDHDRHFSKSQLDHDVWFVVSHGVESTERFHQRTIALEGPGHLDGKKFKQFSRERGARGTFTRAASVLLLACRSGIAGGKWDLPQEILTFGAASVIAPHADVSLRKSLELADIYLRKVKEEGVLPSFAFIEAQRSIENIFDRCHANLFTPMFSDEKGLTKHWLRKQSVPSETSGESVATAQASPSS